MDTVHEHCSRGLKNFFFLVNDLIYGIFILHLL